MPKVTLTVCLLYLSALLCNAQDLETYTIRTGSNIYKQIPGDKIYLYPKFSSGKVISKDQKEYEAFLNYNTISAEIEFLDENKDTAVLTDKFNIKLVTIGADTFCYDNKFVKLLGGNERWIYGAENRFVVIRKTGKVENGIFYTRSSLGTTLKDWEQPLTLSETIVIARKPLYYIGDRFYRFWPLDKKNLLKLFPGYSSRIKTFLRKNNFKLDNEAEITALLTFLNNLK